jgi:hypothetical protein
VTSLGITHVFYSNFYSQQLTGISMFLIAKEGANGESNCPGASIVIS